MKRPRRFPPADETPAAATTDAPAGLPGATPEAAEEGEHSGGTGALSGKLSGKHPHDEVAAGSAGLAAAVDIAWPPPADIPAAALKGAQLVVKAKSERGRRRAGRFFTRQETGIPLVGLTPAEIAALRDDPELVVSVRAAPTGG